MLNHMNNIVKKYKLEDCTYAINYLKGQLHSLLKIRKDLNEQIIQIQNQIESLSNNKIKVKNK